MSNAHIDLGYLQLVLNQIAMDNVTKNRVIGQLGYCATLYSWGVAAT